MECSKLVHALAFITAVGAVINSNFSNNGTIDKKLAKRDVFYLGYGSHNKIYALPSTNVEENPEEEQQQQQQQQVMERKSGMATDFMPNFTNNFGPAYKVNEDYMKPQESYMKPQESYTKSEINRVSPQMFQIPYQNEEDGQINHDNIYNPFINALRKNDLEEAKPYEIVKLFQENALRQAHGGHTPTGNNFGNNYGPTGNQFAPTKNTPPHQIQANYGPIGNQFSTTKITPLQQMQIAASEKNHHYLPAPEILSYTQHHPQIESQKYHYQSSNEIPHQTTSNKQITLTQPLPVHVVQPVVLNNLNELPQLIAATLGRPIKFATNPLPQSKEINRNGYNNEDIKVLSTSSLVVPTSSKYKTYSQNPTLPTVTENSKQQFIGYPGYNGPSHSTHSIGNYNFENYVQPTSSIPPSQGYQQSTYSKSTHPTSPTYETYTKPQERPSVEQNYQIPPNYLPTQLPSNVQNKYVGLGINPSHAMLQSLERYAKIEHNFNNRRQAGIPEYQENPYHQQSKNVPTYEQLSGGNKYRNPQSAIIINDNGHVAYLNSLANKRESVEPSPTYPSSSNQKSFGKYTNIQATNEKENGYRNEHGGRQITGRNLPGFNSDYELKNYYNPQSLAIKKDSNEKPNIIIYPILNSNAITPDVYTKLVQNIIGQKFEDVQSLLKNHSGGQQTTIEPYIMENRGSGKFELESDEAINEYRNREGRTRNDDSLPGESYHILRAPLSSTTPGNNKFSFMSFTLGGDTRHKRKSNN